MIQSHASKVPIPLNCNDVDMDKDSGLRPRPEEQPTQFTIRVWAAKICRLFNRLFINDSNLLSSFEHVKRVDDDLLALLERLPWYCKVQDGEYPTLPPGFEYVMWQHHVLRAYVCTQRVRMFRAFIHHRTNGLWTTCLGCAEDSLSVCRRMRKVWGDDFRRSPKFAVLGWQIVAVAAAVAAFVIIETGQSNELLASDLEMAIADLEALDSKAVSVPIATDVRDALRGMPVSQSQQGVIQPNEFVSPVHSVVGGESAARAYRRWSKSQQRDEISSMSPHLDTSTDQSQTFSSAQDQTLSSQQLAQPFPDSNFAFSAFDDLFTFDSSQWYTLDPFPMATMPYGVGAEQPWNMAGT